MKLSEILAAREKAKEQGAQGKERVSTAPPVAAGKKVLKVIRTRTTPNDDALQFVLNAVILDTGNRSYAARDEAAGDAMAEALFDINGVDNVYVMQNFVTVTKYPEVDWAKIKDPIWQAIDRLVTIYQVMEKIDAADIDVENFPALSEEDKLKAVEMVLNRSIRTNLARDGGGVEVKGIEENTVRIQYHGACGSCATSTTGTLKYIQTQLQQQLHPEIEVQPV